MCVCPGAATGGIVGQYFASFVKSGVEKGADVFISGVCGSTGFE